MPRKPPVIYEPIDPLPRQQPIARPPRRTTVRPQPTPALSKRQSSLKEWVETPTGSRKTPANSRNTPANSRDTPISIPSDSDEEYSEPKTKGKGKMRKSSEKQSTVKRRRSGKFDEKTESQGTYTQFVTSFSAKSEEEDAEDEDVHGMSDVGSQAPVEEDHAPRSRKRKSAGTEAQNSDVFDASDDKTYEETKSKRRKLTTYSRSSRKPATAPVKPKNSSNLPGKTDSQPSYTQAISSLPAKRAMRTLPNGFRIFDDRGIPNDPTDTPIQAIAKRREKRNATAPWNLPESPHINNDRGYESRISAEGEAEIPESSSQQPVIPYHDDEGMVMGEDDDDRRDTPRAAMRTPKNVKAVFKVVPSSQSPASGRLSTLRSAKYRNAERSPLKERDVNAGSPLKQQQQRAGEESQVLAGEMLGVFETQQCQVESQVETPPRSQRPRTRPLRRVTTVQDSEDLDDELGVAEDCGVELPVMSTVSQELGDDQDVQPAAEDEFIDIDAIAASRKGEHEGGEVVGDETRGPVVADSDALMPPPAPPGPSTRKLKRFPSTILDSQVDDDDLQLDSTQHEPGLPSGAAGLDDDDDDDLEVPEVGGGLDSWRESLRLGDDDVVEGKLSESLMPGGEGVRDDTMEGEAEFRPEDREGGEAAALFAQSTGEAVRDRDIDGGDDDAVKAASDSEHGEEEGVAHQPGPQSEMQESQDQEMVGEDEWETYVGDDEENPQAKGPVPVDTEPGTGQSGDDEVSDEDAWETDSDEDETDEQDAPMDTRPSQEVYSAPDSNHRHPDLGTADGAEQIQESIEPDDEPDGVDARHTEDEELEEDEDGDEDYYPHGTYDPVDSALQRDAARFFQTQTQAPPLQAFQEEDNDKEEEEHDDDDDGDLDDPVPPADRVLRRQVSTTNELEAAHHQLSQELHDAVEAVPSSQPAERQTEIPLIEDSQPFATARSSVSVQAAVNNDAADPPVLPEEDDEAEDEERVPSSPPPPTTTQRLRLSQISTVAPTQMSPFRPRSRGAPTQLTFHSPSKRSQWRTQQRPTQYSGWHEEATLTSSPLPLPPWSSPAVGPMGDNILGRGKGAVYYEDVGSLVDFSLPPPPPISSSRAGTQSARSSSPMVR